MPLDLIREVLQLTEGTWSAPQTVEQAQRLIQLLDQPLPASEAAEKLYMLMGDDDLFDHIQESIEKDGPNTDVRPLVKGYIRKWVNNPDMFVNAWDPEALEMLRAYVGA